MNFLRKLFCFAIPLCPICGMLLEKEKFQCKDKVIDIWYCKNSNHENTAPNGILCPDTPIVRCIPREGSD